MGYKKPSLKNRYALERKISKRKKKYVVDKHNHWTWRDNLSEHTWVRHRLSCRDGSSSPYLKECEKACNLQEAPVSIKKERKFW